MRKQNHKLALRRGLILCLLGCLLLGNIGISAFAAEEATPYTVENPISGDLKLGETITKVVDIAPLRWQTRDGEFKTQTAYYVQIGAELTFTDNLSVKFTAWWEKSDEFIWESRQSMESNYYNNGSERSLTFSAPGIYSFCITERPAGKTPKDELPERSQHPELFMMGIFYVGDWAPIAQPPAGTLSVNRRTTTAANVALSDSLGSTAQTLLSRAYDGSTVTQDVTIYQVSQNSTCTVAPAEGSSESLFVTLSEYRLKDGYLDSTDCFPYAQLVADGKIQMVVSPVMQDSPTVAKPARIVFGVNSKANIIPAAGKAATELQLKPGYYYCLSVGGNYHLFGDSVWFAISDSKTTTKPSVTTGINQVTATPTGSAIILDGKSVSLDAYSINSNNYCKIRDVAKLLNGTDKQFEVIWDNTLQAVSMTSNHVYTDVGGELAKGDETTKMATPNTAKIYLDGKEVALTAYTINGNNYVKLRDLGQTFDFGVSFDSAVGAVRIDTSKGYTPE